jgi:putative sterol carrier protein
LSAFPTEPVSPHVFFEDTIPALFAEAELDQAEREMDIRVGVILRDGEDGEKGGEWTLHFIEGALEVAEGRQQECEVTLVQRVDDWRSALWEGRPRLIADAVSQLAESGPNALGPRGAARGAGNPDALKGLSEIHGLIEAIISERSGESEGADDWRIGILIGPGPIPESPQATILLGAQEADAIRRGELHPLEALITGQLRLEGDLGLIIQLQAVAMTASMPKPAVS